MSRNVDTPLNALKRLIRDCDGNQADAAERLDITPQYLGQLLARKRKFSDRIAGKLGFKREWTVKVTTASAASLLR